MPALVLVTSLGRNDEHVCRTIADVVLAPLMADGRRATVHLDVADHFVASLSRRSGQPELIQTWSDDRFHVVLEGYFAGETGSAGDAAFVGGLLPRGHAALARLSGSFVLIAIDRLDRTVTVWTDRGGTRPIFISSSDGVAVVAPELKCFRGLPGVDTTLVPGSLAAMSLNGALLNEHTYYRGVQLIGPARRVTITAHQGVRVDRYWQRSFELDAGRRPPTAAEVVQTLCDATRRHLAPFRRPVLALSGGLDSRLILAAARRAGLDLPAVSWGFDHVAEPGSDCQTAAELARRGGTSHRLLRLDVDALPDHAERIVYLTDGLTGHIGNYVEGEQTARTLAGEFDAVVRGDEVFDGYPPVPSRASALEHLGVKVGKRLWWLRFLLRRDVRRVVLDDYAAQCQGLLDTVPAATPPSDVTDILYPQNRFPRVIASQSPVFRAHLDVVCPLMDSAVVDLVLPCTRAQRAEKRHVLACVRAEFPDEFGLPLAVQHSRTSWRTRFRQLGRVQRYFVETLLEPLAAFDLWFDRTAIRAWLEHALAEGARAPWPARRTLSARARAYLLRPTFKERVVANLVALKLWFKLFES
jgi:hypothetical protein